MLNLNGDCNREIVAKELIEGFDFEPKCLVLVLSAENEREMFDSMIAAGRILTDDFEISVNFTVATGSDPVVKIASTNCHLSKVLLENHALDTTGQAEIDELAKVRTNITMYRELITLWKHVMNSERLVDIDPQTGFATLRDSSPPAPPNVLGPKERLKFYEDNLAVNEARAEVIVTTHSDCFVADRGDETVCGLSSNEAPNPFVALNGVKCRGYATQQAREEDYCGYCEINAAFEPNSSGTFFSLTCSCIHLFITRGFGRQSARSRLQAAQGVARDRTLLH